MYNGASTDTTEDCAIYVDNTNNNLFTGCYIDNGNFYIKTSFNHNITGCHFQRTGAGTNTSAIKIDTAATSETVDGLTVVGASFNGTFTSGEIEFAGTGTYVDDLFKAINWVGNTNVSGADAWHTAKFGKASIMDFGESTHQPTGTTYNLKSPKNIRISADYDADSVDDESKVILATDAVDRWEVNSNGGFLPVNDNAQIIGNSATRVNNVFTNKMTLTDGISAPSTISGFAQIYVQSSDGDLKIKFGDGTVKTIVTDT
jgi:hypothetical protein